MSNMSEDGSMLMDVNNLSELIEFYQIPASFPLNTLNWENLSAVLLQSHYKESCLDRDDLQILKNVYNVMFSDRDIRLENLSTTVHKFGSIKIFNQQFGSTLEYRSKRSTGILAAWARSDGGISEDLMQEVFGLVDFYFSHSIKSDQQFSQHVFACVTWFKATTDTAFYGLSPLVVASKVAVYPGGPSRYLPIQRISAKCGFAVTSHNNETRYIISPLTRRFVS